MLRFLTMISACIFLFSGCIEISNTYTQLPPGKWRAILKITDADLSRGGDVDYDESEKIVDYFELPFNIETAYEDSVMTAYIINGEERIKVEEISFGRNKRTNKDTLQFGFTSFDTKIDALYEENFIEGYWKVPYSGNYSIPFKAVYGQDHRFKVEHPEETYDFDGEWEVTFEFDKPEAAYPAVGVFKQEGNNLSGTFMTETGDYRYLDGNAYGEKMMLSVFDGAHAFLVTGRVSNDTIYGEFRSGKHYKSNWIAVKKEASKTVLRDPYAMTKATTEDGIDFTFPNSEGQSISLSDPQYDGKIKLINIMGTWCPNCRDEIDFLKELKSKNSNVEIISVAFEKYKDEEKCIAQIKKYKDKMDFDWNILYGGYASKQMTGEILGFVDKIYSYPTLLLLDGDNKIIDIHTGFYGPATPEHESFKKEYFDKINKIVG